MGDRTPLSSSGSAESESASLAHQPRAQPSAKCTGRGSPGGLAGAGLFQAVPVLLLCGSNLLNGVSIRIDKDAWDLLRLRAQAWKERWCLLRPRSELGSFSPRESEPHSSLKIPPRSGSAEQHWRNRPSTRPSFLKLPLATILRKYGQTETNKRAGSVLSALRKGRDPAPNTPIPRSRADSEKLEHSDACNWKGGSEQLKMRDLQLERANL